MKSRVKQEEATKALLKALTEELAELELEKAKIEQREEELIRKKSTLVRMFE